MLRKAAFQVHLWLGVATGVVMLVLGATGGILAIEPDLREERGGAVERPPAGSPQPSLGEIVRRAEREHPGYRVWQIRPARENQPLRLVLAGRRPGPEGALLVEADPGSGRILGTSRPGAGWMGWLHRLHGNLLAGPTGRTVNGVFGFALALLSISGFVLWWPRKQWTLTRATSWKRQNWNLHNSAGILTLLFLAVEALSGAYLAFPNATRALMGLPQREPPRPALHSAAVSTAPPEVFLEKALKTWPEFRVAVLNLPLRPGQPVVAAGRLPEDAGWREDSPGVLFLTGLIIWLNSIAARRRAHSPSARIAEANSDKGEHVTYV